MFDERLAAAFIDGGRPHQIFECKLEPFSLWHRFLLRTIDSPFLRKGEVTLFDLRTTVSICRLRPFDCRIRRPAVIIPRVRRASRIKWLSERRDELLDYFGDYLTRPEWAVVRPIAHGPTPPSRSTTPLPEDVQILRDIIGWSGWPEDKVWALPIARAYYYQMAAQSYRGLDIDFLDASERDFQRQMKAAQENGNKRT